ncbi:MAG: ATPase [Kiritimatiellae bacterium]|nr:ATPase [Kiritimatiellia bacterium]
MKDFIESGKAVMGIEFGSTRIKAVLIDDGFNTVAQGAHDWENRLSDGVWSYSMEDIESGIRDAYAKCAADAMAKYGAKITFLKALGISGMMHGYLAFDEKGSLLVPFRTWRNVMTGEAAAKLSDLFGFNIPQRWSVAHYAQALMNNEPHVANVRWLTTLAGYVHHSLSGENVLGVGEASGMFPIDPGTGGYNARMMADFEKEFGVALKEKLPAVASAGESAGRLTEEGAKWLDPTGTLQAGAVMAPPEGDAGTGMVATNAVAPRTGNVSAGTSIFAMIVLEKAMKGHYPEIDVVTTPTGHEVAMVHCNNCTNEINAWAGLFKEFGAKAGADANPYKILFSESLKGDADCGGVVTVPYLSGEPVTGSPDACLKVVRTPEAKFTLANFMRSQIYSAFVSLKIGMDILAGEDVKIDSLTGHGGIFTDKGIAQQYLADALNTTVACLSTATEGGPWGMAVLAAFAAKENRGSLEDFLSGEVFKNAASEMLAPSKDGVEGFDRYTANFKAAITACR